MNVQVKVTGLEELKRKYKYAAKNADRYMSAAGKEAVERFILNEKGIKKYPPETEANRPGRMSLKTHKPMGFYERGKGYWYPVMRKSSLIVRVVEKKGTEETRQTFSNRAGGSFRARRGLGVAGYKLRRTSERYGTKWTIKRVPYGVRLGNSVSYAPYMTGTQQSRVIAKYGWRKLIDVANQNIDKITGVFQAWIEKLHQDAGLNTK